MNQIQKSLFGTIVTLQLGHLFCCGLPFALSMASLASGLGVTGILPESFGLLHEVVHGFEIHILVASFVLLALGWAAHFMAKDLDCHDTGCGHPPCKPKKRKAHIILKVATILFLINGAVYSFSSKHGHDHAQKVSFNMKAVYRI